jgi:hypothetical protein
MIHHNNNKQWESKHPLMRFSSFIDTQMVKKQEPKLNLKPISIPRPVAHNLNEVYDTITMNMLQVSKLQSWYIAGPINFVKCFLLLHNINMLNWSFHQVSQPNLKFTCSIRTFPVPIQRVLKFNTERYQCDIM